MLTVDHDSIRRLWDDVAYVTAMVVDEDGVLVPTANEAIAFKVAGPGVIAAVDSGDNNSHEPFQASERRAYQGRCFAMIKASNSPGRIKITASAPGLASASIVINTANGR